MAIKDEINKIQTEKNYLRAAIQEKGVFVNDEPFALYPVRISEITDTPGECDDELRTLIEKKMTSYTVPSYVDTIGSFVFYNCVNLESITIPDSVTYIGHSSFRGCTSLTSIDIPSSVTSIGNQAFRNCTSLTSVTIGSGVTEIQMYAFYGCSSLASITVNAETPPTLGTRAFDNTNDCPILVPEDSVEAYKAAWPAYADRIQAIPQDNTLFNSIVDRSVTSIDIPNGTTSIGRYAFYNCSSLTSVTIPDSVTTIGESAFQNCTSLTSITIPSSVTSIGDSAFNYCQALASVNIPSSVRTIGQSAFQNCTSLTSVTVNATTPPTLGTMAFDNTNCKILVPKQSVQSYKAATKWSKYADRIQSIPS